MWCALFGLIDCMWCAIFGLIDRMWCAVFGLIDHMWCAITKCQYEGHGHVVNSPKRNNCEI